MEIVMSLPNNLVVTNAFMVLLLYVKVVNNII